MRRAPRPPASIAPIVVLGSDDVASAVGHALHQAGIGVVLARDPTVPVLRRTMSFDDALEYGEVIFAGVRARAAEGLPEVMRIWHHDAAAIPVTRLPVDDLLRLAPISSVIDARMRRRGPKAELRPLVSLAVGLGPGFVAGGNVHVAIETAPEATGRILYSGGTLPAHGRSADPGGAGRERFGRAPHDGLWQSSLTIGCSLAKNALVGRCGETPMAAPIGGRLRGLVRDGTAVAQGTRVLEIDPRGAAAPATGIPPRAAAVAAAVRAAVQEHFFLAVEKRAWSQ